MSAPTASSVHTPNLHSHCQWLLLLHYLQLLAHTEEDAALVDADHPVVVLRGALGRGTGRRCDTGTVDSIVDTAKLLPCELWRKESRQAYLFSRALHHRLDILLLGHIADKRGDLDVGQLGRDGCELVVLDVGDSEARDAAGDKGADSGSADLGGELSALAFWGASKS